MNTNLKPNRGPWANRFTTFTLALAAVAWAACFAPAQAAASLPTPAVLVGSYPAVVSPGVQVRVPLTLAVQLGSHPWQPLPGKALTVRAKRVGGTQTVALFQTTLVTDASGNTAIQFPMPPRLRTAAGLELGTSVEITVQFAGDATLNPCHQNRAIHIIVGN